MEFYSQELAFRKLVGYPPYCDVLLITAEGYSAGAVTGGINKIYRYLQESSLNEYSDIPLRLLSPVAPRIQMLRGKYRMQMFVKCKNSKKFRELIKECRALDMAENVSVTYNMNPLQVF